MTEHDPYRCAGCGVEFIGERSKCDCATGIGIRRSDNKQIICEQRRTVTIPFDEYQALTLSQPSPAASNAGEVPGWADQRLAKAYGLIGGVADEHSSEGDIWPMLKSALDVVEAADCKVGSGE